MIRLYLLCNILSKFLYFLIISPNDNSKSSHMMTTSETKHSLGKRNYGVLTAFSAITAKWLQHKTICIPFASSENYVSNDICLIMVQNFMR